MTVQRKLNEARELLEAELREAAKLKTDSINAAIARQDQILLAMVRYIKAVDVAAGVVAEDFYEFAKILRG